MIIEVRGTGTHNKGAELMLCAIRQRFCDDHPEVELAVDPFFGTYAERARYGLLSKARAMGLGRATVVQRLMSPAYRKTYGLVVDSDVDAVLDAAGFAYGDQWGIGPTREAAQRTVEAQRRGTPVILLPQAFGPFTTSELRTEAVRLIQASTLVFARDKVSLHHLQDLGPFEHVHLAPDFTSVIEGVLPPGLTLPEKLACIVPNVRMLDRGPEQERRAYVGFLAEAVRQTSQLGLEPVFLFHDEVHDTQVADLVEKEYGQPVPRLLEHLPERLKGILGQSTVVIGSRFHALVGALSQAVPCIVTGWSHKYEMLLEDYGCPDFLLKPSCPIEEFTNLLNRVSDDESRHSVTDCLHANGAKLKQQVEEMFQMSAEAIGLIPEVVRV